MSDLEKEENKNAEVTEVLNPEELTVTETEEETGEDPAEEEENGSKRKKTIIAVIAALAVILIVAGSAIALSGNNKEEVATPAPKVEVAEKEKAVEAKTFITVDAKDATKDNTTPVKISIKDVKSGKFVKEAEFPVSERYDMGLLPEGEYEVYVSRVPVFDDGSTYKLPEKPHEFAVNKTTAEKDIEITVLLDKKLNAKNMTKEQLEESAKILDHFDKKKEANAVRKAASKAESDPDSVKDLQQAEDTTVTAPVATKQHTSNTTASSNVNSSHQASNSGSSSSSSGSSSSSSSNSSSSGSSNSGNSSTPSHQHSWTAVTEQQWVSDGQKWVVDEEAWTEEVEQGSYIQCSCGATFNSNSEWSAHNKGFMLNGEPSHSYSVVPNWVTITHPEQGHYEDTGHYETVTIGYKCSCGAWK